MSKSNSSPLLARRWIWLIVAALAIFLSGVAVGAGAKFTDIEEKCGIAASAIVQVT